MSSAPLWREAMTEEVRYSVASLYAVINVETMKLPGGQSPTACRTRRRGRWRNESCPCRPEQLPTGTDMVHPPTAPSIESAAIYAQVSSADQKADLVEALAAAQRGNRVKEVRDKTTKC
jgi:hypothetical protein